MALPAQRIVGLENWPQSLASDITVTILFSREVMSWAPDVRKCARRTSQSLSLWYQNSSVLAAECSCRVGRVS